MKVLVLSQYFWPEPIPKPLEVAEALRDEGHDVRIVTGFPNYPHGNLYPGYPLRLLRRDVVSGMPVIRTLVYPSHGVNRIGRMLNYASFMLSSIAGGLLAGRFDVMYVWHPPLSIGIAAAAIASLRGRRFVYDVLDIWPESAVATGFMRPGTLFDVFARVETFVYRRAAHIFVVTDAAKANLIGKGVPDAKISVAAPWYDDVEIRRTKPADRDIVRSQEGWQDRFVVMFAGNMGVLQGLDTLVQAGRRLPQDSGILIVLVGDGVELPRLKELVRDLELDDRVRFVARQPPSEMARYFAAADALVVHLRPSAVDHFTIPAKTIAYLAASKPIVLASGGASAAVVSKAGAGVVVPAEDPPRLADALLEISRTDASDRARMGQRGRAYFEAHFTKTATIPSYVAALKRAAEGSDGARVHE